MTRLPLFLTAGLLAATPVLAATRDEHKFSLTFSSRTPGTATAISFLTDRSAYKAPPAGKPADRVATTTFIMAPGTRTNLAAYPKCSRSGLAEKGPMACPARSRVGTGKAYVITGLAALDPVTLTATIFVARNGLLAFLEGSGQRQVIAMSVTRNKIVAAVPRQCLSATGKCEGSYSEAVLKKLTVHLNKGRLITTPRTCPSSGKWTNSVVYKFVDGTTERKTSASPCKR